jgi:Cu/Ag efflux pump CusA
MLRIRVAWSVGNPLIVLLCVVALAGIHSSTSMLKRQVTVPLEVTLAGMPGLKYTSRQDECVVLR